MIRGVLKRVSERQSFNRWDEGRKEGVHLCLICLERMPFEEARRHRCPTTRAVRRLARRRIREARRRGKLTIL